MRNIVAGTAGHIDHGKTALVRALTGIDTDRLEEEKRRGISIDIGFAHLSVDPELRVAFVDVPGHERFIKNMLAGVGGIDLLVLVVAADSSIQPQTREHFEIARLLGIRTGLVAITKTDLVDREIVDLVRLEVDDLTAGSFLENAPVIPVSAATGEGLQTLKQALAALAKQVPGRDTAGHFRLPVDRSFAAKGFGAVITGTLWSGSVAIEDEVEVHPGGARARVRGIQVHGDAAAKAQAGQRTALNLAGVDHSQLARGMVLTAPGLFRATRTIDAAVDLLASAKPLRHRAPVHFHSGTAEVEAEIRQLQGTAAFEPGRRHHARFVLRDPCLLLPGDRFIIRMFSPVVTIGGGTVLDIDPPRKSAAARTAALEDADPAKRIQVYVSEAEYGLPTAELVRRTGLTERAIRGAATEFLTGWYLAPERVQAMCGAWREQLSEFHKTNPLQPGIPKEHLRGEVPAAVFEEVLRRCPAVVITGDVAHLATHKLALRQEEEQALAQIESAFAKGGLKTPAVADVLSTCGVEAARSRALLQILLRQNRLVRVTEDLVFHRTALEELRSLIRSHKGQQFGVAEFKDWTGISRKYAIPLLEMLDRERITRRTGDTRTVL